jgi:hypothetical protein
MGWVDLLQALPRKRKIEPQTVISYMKEGGLSSIFETGIRPDHIFCLAPFIALTRQGRSGYITLCHEAMSQHSLEAPIYLCSL